MHYNDAYVPIDIQRGESPGNTNAQPHGQRDVVESQAKQGPEQRQRRAEQRRRLLENIDAQRGTKPTTIASTVYVKILKSRYIDV